MLVLIDFMHKIVLCNILYKHLYDKSGAHRFGESCQIR